MKKAKIHNSSQPSVVINGDGEVILEGKFKLLDYSSARVVLDLKHKGRCAVVEGDNLRLCVLAENVVSVTGKISSFSYAHSGDEK